MTFHDAINAGFEAGLAVMIANNIRCLYRDKQVKGFSLWTVTWVTAWGFWNLYYYPAVNSPLSFWAGIAVVLANATWLGLALYYVRRDYCKLTCVGGSEAGRCACVCPRDCERSNFRKAPK
jgi:hypothetical protein